MSGIPFLQPRHFSSGAVASHESLSPNMVGATDLSSNAPPLPLSRGSGSQSIMGYGVSPSQVIFG
jgi:hypothetical protein